MGEFKMENQSFENRNVSVNELKRRLVAISAENNNRVKTEYGKANLLEQNGSLSMDAFSAEKGGIYSKEEIEEDKKEIREAELHFAEVDKRADKKTQDMLIAEWKERRIKQKSGKVEMMVTILLNKVLGDEFIVMRTADYDDYFAGTDFIIVNKKTGKTICALDSVAENDSKLKEGDTPMTIKKSDKTMAIVEKGGADIKYGVKIKNGEMTLAPLKNMPVFYFDVSDQEYDSLSENTINKEEITKTELKIFASFITSLAEQRKNFLLAADIKKDSVVSQRIESFEQETLTTFVSIFNKRRLELKDKK
ncbi:MAG: hypothetical protein AAB438_01875 [Patescibacteria group bacterium]